MKKTDKLLVCNEELHTLLKLRATLNKRQIKEELEDILKKELISNENKGDK